MTTDGHPDTAEAHGHDGGATVMIVDDEPDLAAMYADALRNTYDVVTSTGGEEALDQMGPGIDAVLLDRRMPELSGGEVIERMRDAGYRCPVAMITAVEPDFDIIDMGFHDYLVKPIDVNDLHETVENLLAISKYEGKLREYVSLTVKDATLQRIKAADDLHESDDYQELREDMQELSTELGDWTTAVAPEDFDRVLRMVVRSL